MENRANWPPHVPSYILPTSPLWTTAAALLTRRGIDFFVLWKGARHTLCSNACRDFRIATRRLRECLLLFGPCYRENELSRIIRVLEKLTKRLGALRTIDKSLLFMERISGETSPATSELASTLRKQLTRERKRETRQQHRYLSKIRRQSLAALFYKFCYTPVLFVDSGVDPFMPVRSYVHGAILSLLADTAPLAAAGMNEADAGAQRRWRIAVRKIRYQLEIVTPVVTATPENVLKTLRSYQELLGDLHDLDIYRELVENRIEERDAVRELVDIMISERSLAWRKLVALMQEHPWERLSGQIRETL